MKRKFQLAAAVTLLAMLSASFAAAADVKASDDQAAWQHDLLSWARSARKTSLQAP